MHNRIQNQENMKNVVSSVKRDFVSMRMKNCNLRSVEGIEYGGRLGIVSEN